MSETPAAPRSPAERDPALDVARGVAVLGILLMNIWAFAGPQAFFDYPLALAGEPGAPVATWAVMHTFFEGSQRTLLSLLFGAGGLLLLLRLEASGARARRIYYRRTGLLILFGLINAYVFMWPADILFAYGLAGLCLYPLRRLRARTLMLIALGLLLIPTALRVAAWQENAGLESAWQAAMAAEEGGRGLDPDEEQAISRWEAALAKARPSATDEKLQRDMATMASGSLPQIFVKQARASLILQTIVLAKWWFVDALAAMILGMALCRAGWLDAAVPRVRLQALAVGGLAAGAGLGAWETWTLLSTDFHPVAGAFARLGYDVRRFALALGWLGLILLASRAALGHWLTGALAATGRMALTNYLAQSILCAFIFYGFGLGLYGQLTGYRMYGVVLAIWAATLAWSPWWLTRYRYGPVEWLWRAVAYRPAAAANV